MVTITCNCCKQEIKSGAYFGMISITTRDSIYSDSNKKVHEKFRGKHYCTKCLSKIIGLIESAETEGHEEDAKTAEVQSEVQAQVQVQGVESKVVEAKSVSESRVTEEAKIAKKPAKEFAKPQATAEVKKVSQEKKGSDETSYRGKKLPSTVQRRIYNYHKQGRSGSFIAKQVGLSQPTVSKYIRELDKKDTEAFDWLKSNIKDCNDVHQVVSLFNLNWRVKDIVGDTGFDEKVVKQVITSYCEIMDWLDFIEIARKEGRF